MNIPITKAPKAAAPAEWWNCENPCPRPDELFCFAALHDRAAIHLNTQEELDRVAEDYIAASRMAGHWLHFPSHVPYHANGERAYRDRVKEYKAALAFWLCKWGQQ